MLNLKTVVFIHFIVNFETSPFVIGIKKRNKNMHLKFMQYINSIIRELIFILDIFLLNLMVRIAIIKYSTKYYIFLIFFAIYKIDLEKQFNINK